MNLNFNSKPDYQLNTNLIDEMIRLYGTPVRMLFMDKIRDSKGVNNHESPEVIDHTFEDFKSLKTNLYRDELEFYVLLSDSEEFPNGLAFAFNNFGMINDDTLQVFVSLNSLKSLEVNGEIHPKEIQSNVLVFPNGKVMEITDCQLHVPGVNNKFVYSNIPSCYQFSLKSYAFDRSAVEKVSTNDSRIDVDVCTNNHLDAFFVKQDEHAEKIKESAEAEDLVVSDNLQDTVKRNKIDDVFGSYG